jgi:O-antigen ligase
MSGRDIALEPGVRPGAAAAPRGPAIYRDVLFAMILLVIWIGTKPFGALAPGEVEAQGGNLVNQLTFAGLAAASIGALWLTGGRALKPLLQPSYAILLGWLFVSVAISAEADDALRALAFTVITMLLAATIYALPGDAERFRALLFGSALAALALSWFGVIAMSDVAIHTDDDPIEPEHAGSWRGHFTHKNIAGAMMAIFAIIGVYALRSGRRLIGLGLLIGAVTFLYFTRSKTSFMLLPVVITIGFMAEWLRHPALRAALLLGPVAALNLLTLGSALSPAIAAFNRETLKDPTFTGRLDIWRFGFEKLAERPWTGFGFESFWKSEAIVRMESKLELSWLVQNIVHGHNGYLDVALGMGLPGLALVVWIFLVKPVRDYANTRATPANQRLATAFIMIWLFISLCMCLEVFYFRRSDPIWFTLVVAVFGLRMTASHRIDDAPR